MRYNLKAVRSYLLKEDVCFFWEYKSALAKDPNYALAYSGIADCYSILGSIFGALRPSQAFPKARAAAEKALALDASLSEAHASLGICAFYYDWDWATAERVLRRSLELNPDNAAAHRIYSVFLAAFGRMDEAIREGRPEVWCPGFSNQENAAKALN